MRLLLKVLDLNNFKGIKQFRMMFDNTEVKVYGANGTGKTTLVDAFMWLLFDKDSQDRKDFEIKTLDSNNQPIHFLDHEVTGVFSLDNKTVTLSKKLNEKWVKKRGQAQQEFGGHETTYYIDGAPCKKSEYQGHVSEIINEKTFKLLTNPFSFENMKWQDKRKILFEVCGNVDDRSVTGYEKLQEFLNGKEIDSFKKSLAATKKKLKQDIENIPPRIDELKRSIESGLDKATDLKQIAEKEQLLEELNKQLEASQGQFEVIREKQQQILSLERTKEELIRHHQQENYGETNRIKQALEHTKFNLHNNQSEQDKLVKLIEIKQQDNIIMSSQVDTHREEWQQVFDETFDEHKSICPTCGQDLPSDKIQELINKYESEKIKRLESIVNLASSKKANIEQHNKDIREYASSLEVLKNDKLELTNRLEELTDQLETPLEVTPLDTTAIDAQLNVLKSEIENFSTVDNSKIKEQIKSNQANIDIKKLRVAKVERQEETLERIGELEQQLKDLQVSLAEIEKQEILVEDFTRAKVDMLEENINSKFTTVKFKLFDEQINGGLAECCESLIDGVPFSNANNAAKVAAGIDIINVLSNHYGFYAPIWLDNRESVTDIPSTQSQVINLIVSENDKELRCK